MIIDFVRAGACRLYSLTQCKALADMAQRVAEQRAALGMDTLRALFFLIVNVDMPIKEYLCAPGDRALYATAIGMADDAEGIERLHSYSMLGTRPMERDRARRFMLELGNLVRAWLSNEALTPSDLVAMIKEEYLVS